VAPYHGGPYNEEEYELVENLWDHEHCGVCHFSIEEGHSYWEDGEGAILCDACHDHYVADRSASEEEAR
jgi:hypothetical protein